MRKATKGALRAVSCHISPVFLFIFLLPKHPGVRRCLGYKSQGVFAQGKGDTLRARTVGWFEFGREVFNGTMPPPEFEDHRDILLVADELPLHPKHTSSFVT